MGRLVNPFEIAGSWYKANFHTHTTTSDGEVSAEERAKQYIERGYSILAITDHEKTNDVSRLSSRDFLVISGIETHPPCPATGGQYHLVCINVAHGTSFGEDRDANQRIDMVRRGGGEVIFGHPYWCGHQAQHIVNLSGCAAIEVFNATCTKIGKGTSSVHWDDILDAGLFLPAVACDDTHSGRDIFMGWSLLKLGELSLRAVLQALRTGCFYSSSGPVIEDFHLESRKVHLRSSPAVEIHLMCERSNGGSFYADAAQPLTEAQLELPQDAKYVRGEVVDASGRRAWTNPIVLTPDKEI